MKLTRYRVDVPDVGQCTVRASTPQSAARNVMHSFRAERPWRVTVWRDVTPAGDADAEETVVDPVVVTSG